MQGGDVFSSRMDCIIAMSESPAVAIVILTWNGKADTLECLASLRDVSYPSLQLIVVDNGSADGTAPAVRQSFPTATVIENSLNLRFAGGNNVGIRDALNHGAEYILLLNNDTTVERDFLQQMVEAALANKGVGMVGPKIKYYHDRQRLWYAGGRIEWWKGWISHIGVREIDHGQYDSRLATDYVTGCCMLVSRELLLKVGMLDESYFIYGEDADWCIRAARAGFRLLYEPHAVIYHKLSVSAGGHFSWFKNWNKLKSNIRLMARYATFYHWLTIPFLMPIQIVKGFVSARHGTGG